MQRLRLKTKGAARAKGESKMREGENKIRMENIRDHVGKLTGTRAKGENKRLKEKIKRCK